MKARVKSANVNRALKKAARIQDAAVSAYTMAARRDSEPYVPYMTGALRESAHSESEPELGRLVYGNARVPYAKAQYYEYPHKRFPGTVTEWFEAAKETHGLSWIREAELAAKEAAGS